MPQLEEPEQYYLYLNEPDDSREPDSAMRIAQQRLIWEDNLQDPHAEMIFNSHPFSVAYLNLREAAAILRERAFFDFQDHGAKETEAADILIAEDDGEPDIAKEVSKRFDALCWHIHGVDKQSAYAEKSLADFADFADSDRAEQMLRAQGKVNHELIYRGVIGIALKEIGEAREKLGGLQPPPDYVAEVLERLDAAEKGLQVAEKERTSPAKGETNGI